MNKLSIPHYALVFVGDGGKALFLRNEGDEKFPNLRTERVFAEQDPPTHEQGTDAPGRTFSGPHVVGRSAVEATDWHAMEKNRFAKRSAPR
jgi:protein required for attachment to host cells